MLKGDIAIGAGKVEYPTNVVEELGNNEFIYDIVDNLSKPLSEKGWIEFRAKFKYPTQKDLTFTLQNVRLCDGGYSEGLKKENDPPLPAGCRAVEKSIMQSSAHGNDGKRATFHSKIDNTPNIIGCGAYVLVGFDDKTNVDNLVWPIAKAKRVSKQLKECNAKMQDNGCDGHFYRLDFFNSNVGFTESTNTPLQMDLVYNGTESHVPIGTFQYVCDLGKACGDGDDKDSDSETDQAGQANNNGDQGQDDNQQGFWENQDVKT